MALLAAYMIKKDSFSLGDWLDAKVFGNMKNDTLTPELKSVNGFDKFYNLYKEGSSMLF